MPRLPKGMRKVGPSYYWRMRRGGQDRWINLGREEREARKEFRRLRNGGAPRTPMTVTNRRPEPARTFSVAWWSGAIRGPSGHSSSDPKTGRSAF